MLIIDRFEEGWAIIEMENGIMFKLPRTLIPPFCKEGDVLRLTVEVDQAETNARVAKVQKYFQNFFDE